MSKSRGPSSTVAFGLSACSLCPDPLMAVGGVCSGARSRCVGLGPVLMACVLLQLCQCVQDFDVLPLWDKTVFPHPQVVRKTKAA